MSSSFNIQFCPRRLFCCLLGYAFFSLPLRGVSSWLRQCWQMNITWLTLRTANDVKAYDRPRISFLNSWDTPPSLQDKVYQPLRQRISQTEIYCIMRWEHCELNLYFCLFVFHIRDWSRQSEWQTAAKLMRQQPTEISRWGIMWATMRSITRPSSFMKSFEARDFTLLSHSGEEKNVFCNFFPPLFLSLKSWMTLFISLT